MLCVFSVVEPVFETATADLRVPNTTLPSEGFFVFFGAAILSELNDKKHYGGHQQEMNHPALVQQEFGNEPANQKQTSGKPEHGLIRSLMIRELQYSKP